MVVLHGLGDSMEGYRFLPEALNMPSMSYVLVNAPEAYYDGFSWYDYFTDPAPGVLRSRGLLHELLDECESKGYPGDETVLFGFSQGCLMTLDVGLRRAEPLAGLIGISGHVFEPETLVSELSEAAKTRPVLMTHGTVDTVIPIEKVRPQVALLKAAKLALEWREFEKPHTIAGENELRFIRDFTRNCLGIE